MDPSLKSKVINKPITTLKIKYSKAMNYMHRHNIKMWINPKYRANKYIPLIIVSLYQIIFIDKHNFISDEVKNDKYITRISYKQNNVHLFTFSKEI